MTRTRTPHDTPPRRHSVTTVNPAAPAESPTDRNPAIKAIRAALKRRSGVTWSVRGGTGTARGWITISAPPARLDDFDRMSDDDADRLRQLLGLTSKVSRQGVDVAASSDYRQEYIDRAEGRRPSVVGRPYWD